MTLGEAQDMVARCGADMKPPVAGKLVHAWDGWADHEATPPVIVYTHDQVKEARQVIRDKVSQLTEGPTWLNRQD